MSTNSSNDKLKRSTKKPAWKKFMEADDRRVAREAKQRTRPPRGTGIRPGWTHRKGQEILVPHPIGPSRGSEETPLHVEVRDFLQVRFPKVARVVWEMVYCKAEPPADPDLAEEVEAAVIALRQEFCDG